MKDKKVIMTQMKTPFFLSLLLTFAFSSGALSQDLISEIHIKGNKIVSDATIISKIKSRSGTPINENVINQDQKNLMSTGFFEYVNVDKDVTQEGADIVFIVKEKPVLKNIKIEGARRINKKKIEESLMVEEGSFVDEYKLKESVRKIEDLYIKKGFSQATIVYDLNLNSLNEADVSFVISEKDVLKIRAINIEGNLSFKDKKIKRLMKTRKAWLLNRGVLKDDQLNDDLDRLKDFYKNEGFTDAKVSFSTAKVRKGLAITIKIEEGTRYHIGEIKIQGNKQIAIADLRESMRVLSGDPFSERKVYEDSSKLKGVYVDNGYIFASVEPLSVYNLKTGKVDLTYNIVENNIAFVEKVNIKGNLKTKDKVIRRELRVYPGDKFDGKKIRKSKERLDNLGYFEEIVIDTEPGTKQDWVDLVLDVKEAKTGYLSFGGGYSSIDEFIGFVELRQRNFDFRNWSTFTGAGQDLSVYLSLGNLTTRYQLSFTNPWIYDRPISFGFDAYRKGHKREENVGYGYEQDIQGGALRLSREFADKLQIGTAYRLERITISDVVEDATSDLKSEVGKNNLSSGEFFVSLDTRDNVFVPTKGYYFTNNIDLTGSIFAGDKDFVKYSTRLSLYQSLINKSVVELKLRAGFADPFSSTDTIPIYKRFFAGGASTIRGYNERKVGPIDDVTDDPLGGEAMFVGNLEYTYPLADFLKVATFFDSGNVWEKNSDFLSGSLKSSVGLGLRVKTPIGPVSIDYGWPLDLEPGEQDKEGMFHFNISRGF
ncbi:MAG: outer membrane protein assembly factor BamA [Candidatus Omnitrophica bacterium]|nr:outer membrane protein assembly factor BamA [Candidatus Omnitrophota bacterium]